MPSESTTSSYSESEESTDNTINYNDFIGKTYGELCKNVKKNVRISVVKYNNNKTRSVKAIYPRELHVSVEGKKAFVDDFPFKPANSSLITEVKYVRRNF